MSAPEPRGPDDLERDLEAVLEPVGWSPPQSLTAEQVLRLAAGETGADVAPMETRLSEATPPEEGLRSREGMCLRPSVGWECRAPAGHTPGMHVWGQKDDDLLFHAGWTAARRLLNVPVEFTRDEALAYLRSDPRPVPAAALPAPVGEDELIEVLAAHRLTTPVQCSCGWRELDGGRRPDDFRDPWAVHVAGWVKP